MKNYSILAQILVVIAGVLLSSAIGWFLYDVKEKAIIGEFQKTVDDRAASLHREVSINFETLRSLALLFDEDAVPDSKKFSRSAKKILNRHQDIQALEWIPRVIHSQRAIYESKQWQEFPEYEFTERKEQGHMVTAEEREEYFPVYYVEPLLGNEVAFGFDLSANLTRLKTLENSRDSATPQATASITLVQERENQKGFLAFIPIYKGNPSTVDKRRENLKGFVLGVYRVGDIFSSSALGEEQSEIEMKLIDETLSSENDILHIHKLRTGLIAHENITYKKELPDIWGRKWSLVASPTLSYINIRRDFVPQSIFLTGLIFTFIIVFYINIITTRASTIQRIVTKRTNELTEANKRLEFLSSIDGLTGVANRRVMDEFLELEWLRAIRNKTSISFILIDIDFFKLYNDNYGHPKGDKCLKKVATTLKDQFNRPGDLVARYGGEEFAIVIADTENAKYVSNRCRRSIEELQIQHEFSQAADVVTISVGLCTVFPEIGSDPISVIDTADKALYRAKAEGRNRAIAFPQGESA